MLTRLASVLAVLWFLVVALALLVVAHGAAIMIRALPRVDGDVRVRGLHAPLTIDRDALGIAVIRGATQADVAFGQGFAHAQDRFFQMDLLRRTASGRLSEVVGGATMSRDFAMRPHRFEEVANDVLAHLPEAHRALLSSYTSGVNAGLEAMAAPPFEYRLLSWLHGERIRPQAWGERDTLLVALSMTTLLSAGQGGELARTRLEESLPTELVAFLLPDATRYDAPMLGADEGVPSPIVPTRGPVYGKSNVPRALRLADERSALGSNNWAISRIRSAHGGAMLANDMHLPLAVPNVWYRVQLHWQDEASEGLCVGVSLPGVPGVIVGSNGHVAWGFTNAFVDVQDWVLIDVDPADPARYMTPDGSEPFGSFTAEFAVAGRAVVERRTWRTTRWGIVVEDEPPRVLRWTALDPAKTNLDILDMWSASSLEEAVKIARGWRGPAQNVALAAADGRIAWTISGFLPDRIGFDGRTSVSWADGDHNWDDVSDEAARPQLIDPEDGVVWSANNRTMPVPQTIGFLDEYGLGCRAQRIRELIGTRAGLLEGDMLQMQLDTRIEVGEPYRRLAMEAGAGAPVSSRAARAAEAIRHWNGEADAAETAYPVVRDFYMALCDRVLNPMLEPAGLTWRSLPSTRHEALLVLLAERPAHFLPPGFATWNALILDALDEAGAKHTSPSKWGEANRLRMRHPLALGLPKWVGLFDMPAHRQDGDVWAVRVSDDEFGASQRLVVSPGREALGILHMPGGQSGNPVSPHYRAGHRAWAMGEATPLLAGPAQHSLRLTPAGQQFADPP